MPTTTGLDRRRLLSLIAAAGGAQALSACAATTATRPPPVATAFRAPKPLARLDARPERIFNITVCLRPFRAAGPRLDVEHIGQTLVAHNYGHGGSGWSLSWGSAQIAVRNAMSRGDREIAVIGCGALGLTAAITAQRAGAKVTIYARERMPDVRSARATGVWSPDSRIALAADAPPDFPALWEQMTRASYKAHLGYLGLAGGAVRWMDHYFVPGGPEGPSLPHMEFAHYGGRVRDLTPRGADLPAGAHPFAADGVRRGSQLVFDITELGHLLMSDFLMAGGRIEPREFHAPAELASLSEKAVINCTGYGARALWKDETVIPVRGQIGWLVPQPELDYSLYHGGVSMVPRHDGVVIQATGGSDAYGYGDANETPDRAETEVALATLAALYARPKAADVAQSWAALAES
ncbi:MAG TPA: FAD-dependent oxidoreductase [Phenylobacterium sp.]|nr:FAD-dependent oxidoreductase [Phenylobacterium sp.]